MLNEKQERFSQAYVLHRNATEAARTAGYATNSANNQGYRLLQIQEIQDRVTELEQELDNPVGAINVALYWHALSQNGINAPISGFGRLLNNS